MDLTKLVRPQVVELVEDVLNLEVVDLLSDTTLETGRTGPGHYSLGSS